jgi:hypothetical protein
MEIKPVHPVYFLTSLLILTLSGENIMVKHSVGKTDLILIGHAGKPV